MIERQELEKQNRTYHEAQDHMRFLPNYYAWMYGKVAPYVRGEVVEIGCGAGLGIPFYLDKAAHVTAVDYNQALTDQVAQRFPADAVAVRTVDLIADWCAISDIKADTIIMMDVLEHFEDDALFLRNASGIMNSGGKILIKVPAQSALYGEADRASGHYRRYDRDRLQLLADQVGLTVEVLKRVNPLGAIGYRRKRHNKSNFSKTFTPGQLKVINALIPVLRLFDHVPLGEGLSKIAVLRKP